jgi:hypothetical protein
MNTLSTITIFPSSEEEIAKYVRSLKAEILASKEPLKVLSQLKYAEKTIAIILKDKELDNLFIDEAYKFGESFDYLGHHFDIRETGTKYDYAGCKDSVWDYLNEKSDKLNAEIKAREAFLKTLPLEGTVNPETGELIHRPPKTSSTKVVVKL